MKNKLFLIEWNRRKFIALGFLLFAGLLIYGFLSFGLGDIFTPTADYTGATSVGIRAVADANNRFAVGLYSEMSRKTDGNIFFSPWSITTAMAMAYEGARSDTADEMQKVFGFPQESNSRRASFARMLNMLNKAGGKYELLTANAIWLQKDYSFLRD
ncbi:MAG: serpin family protein, partial [Candidatus Micrarchaeota archaeon]|nr:serpin family protein [Candidatus Micrarchaeota archaeon]